LTAILDRFLQLWKQDATPQHMVAELRLLPELRLRLPGAGTHTTLHRLGDRLEQRIEQAVARDNGHFVLALDPVDCQAMLSAVREQVGESPRALVVRDRTLRPFVRKLVELEFPDLSVLAAEELQADMLPAGLPIVDLDK